MLHSAKYIVEQFTNTEGKSVIREWPDGLRDTQARSRVATRLQRLKDGNFGDHKPIGDGVWELRIDYGPGYRVYYAQEGKMIILLLCGSDKRAQNRDIKRAIEYWKEHKRKNRA